MGLDNEARRFVIEHCSGAFPVAPVPTIGRSSDHCWERMNGRSWPELLETEDVDALSECAIYSDAAAFAYYLPVFLLVLLHGDDEMERVKYSLVDRARECRLRLSFSQYHAALDCITEVLRRESEQISFDAFLIVNADLIYEWFWDAGVWQMRLYEEVVEAWSVLTRPTLEEVFGPPPYDDHLLEQAGYLGDKAFDELDCGELSRAKWQLGDIVEFEHLWYYTGGMLLCYITRWHSDRNTTRPFDLEVHLRSLATRIIKDSRDRARVSLKQVEAVVTFVRRVASKRWVERIGCSDPGWDEVLRLWESVWIMIQRGTR